MARANRRRCFFAAALAAALAANLGACADGEVANPLDAETWAGRKIEGCLTVRPLAAASTYIKFRDGGGRDLTDIAVRAEFVDVGALCGSTAGIGGVISRDGGLSDLFAGSINQSAQPSAYGVEVRVSGWRGPAEQGETVHKVPYFVAILDLRRRIISKKLYTAELHFPAGVTRVTQTEPARIALRFPKLDGIAPWQLDILVGFQLTEEQLEYARSQEQ